MFVGSRMTRGLGRLRVGLFDRLAVLSYSQEGEDLILQRMFDGQQAGFYVDVGAHHPRRYSNTHIFYRRGWKGINIEPNPQAMRLFARQRSRDCNVQLGVAEQAGSMTYHEFDEPALNTFDEKLAAWRSANTRYRVVGRREIPVQPLAGILQRHLPANQSIDFLSIDVEGLDLAVLRSNDWRQFRPRCVLAEAFAALWRRRGSPNP